MSATSRPVLLVGDANADVIVQLPPEPGNRQPVTPPEVRLGGTVANTAAALAALGAPVQFAGALGDDGYGRFAAQQLAARGVDVSHVVFTREAFTTVVLVIVERTGERTLFGWPRRGGAHGRRGHAPGARPVAKRGTPAIAARCRAPRR